MNKIEKAVAITFAVVSILPLAVNVGCGARHSTVNGGIANALKVPARAVPAQGTASLVADPVAPAPAMVALVAANEILTAAPVPRPILTTEQISSLPNLTRKDLVNANSDNPGSLSAADAKKFNTDYKGLYDVTIIHDAIGIDRIAFGFDADAETGTVFMSFGLEFNGKIFALDGYPTSVRQSSGFGSVAFSTGPNEERNSPGQVSIDVQIGSSAAAGGKAAGVFMVWSCETYACDKLLAAGQIVLSEKQLTAAPVIAAVTR